jgi:ligand-binding sensor domain-containing protein
MITPFQDPKSKVQLKGVWANYHSGNCPLPKGSFVSKLVTGAHGSICIYVNRLDTHVQDGFNVIEGKTEGVLMFHEKQWSFRSLPKLGIPAILNAEITCEGNNKLWLYAPPGMVYGVGEQNIEIYKAGETGLPTDFGWVRVFDLDPAGKLRILCTPGGVFQLNGKIWEKLPLFEDNNPDLWITYFTTDSTGRIWVAAQDAQSTVFTISEQDKHKTYAKVPVGREDGIIQAMVVDHEQTLWVSWDDFGNSGHGLWHITQKETWKKYTVWNSPLIDNNIKSLTLDPKGRVWAGTTGGFGIFHQTDAVSWEFIRPDLVHGPLTQKQIDQAGSNSNGHAPVRISDYAVVDNHGHIWATSANGVSRFSEE